MAESQHPWLKLATTITTIGGAIAILYMGGGWIMDMTELIATKEYHDASMHQQEVGVQKQLELIQTNVAQVEAGMAVPRIQNILNLKCSTEGDIPIEVERILQRSIDRYEEIEERKFDTGECIDGRYVTTYEAKAIRLQRRRDRDSD